MIRHWMTVSCVLAVLAGCSLNNRPEAPSEDTPEPGISISGTAVMGVAGGSGKSTRVVSGVKDLELTVGVELDG
jgi:hypothetical protein